MLVDNLITISAAISAYSINQIDKICMSAVMVGLYKELNFGPHLNTSYDEIIGAGDGNGFLLLRGKKPMLPSSFEQPILSKSHGSHEFVPKDKASTSGNLAASPIDKEFSIVNNVNTGIYNPPINPSSVISNSGVGGVSLAPNIPSSVVRSKPSSKSPATGSTTKRSAAEGDQSLQSI